VKVIFNDVDSLPVRRGNELSSIEIL